MLNVIFEYRIEISTVYWEFQDSLRCEDVPLETAASLDNH